MAKNRHAFLKLRGMGSYTFVDSIAYGPHTRLKRGTHKEARCNAVLDENSKKAAQLTRLAKPLLSILKASYGAFLQKDLWQQIMKRFFRSADLSPAGLLQSLKGLDLHKDYGLHRFVGQMPLVQVRRSGSSCFISLSPSAVQFPAALDADSYYWRLTVIWIKEAEPHCETACMQTAWTRLTEVPGRSETLFSKPLSASMYLLVLELQACRKGKLIEDVTARSIQITESGRC